MIEEESLVHPGDRMPLDGFAFWPDYASRIGGLGGASPAPDPYYTLHTRYVKCADGQVAFHGQFEGLEATGGTVILRVNEYPVSTGGNARQVAMQQIQLRDLQREGGDFVIECPTWQGNSYALLAHLYGDATVGARSLSITAELAAYDAERWRRQDAEADARVSPGGALLSLDAPELHTPFSQPFTRAQLREPVFQRIAGVLKLDPSADEVERWSAAFVASVWQAYGVARPDAAMIGIAEREDAPLVARAREVGLHVTLASAAEVLDGAVPDGGNPGWARRQADVCWSVLAPEAAAGWSASLRFLEASLLGLKPGGLAVHVFAYDASILREHALEEHLGALTRSDVQRIALVLISRGHRVVQLRVGAPGPAGRPDVAGEARSAFGIVIARRM